MAPRNTDLTQPLTEEFIRTLTKAQLIEVKYIYEHIRYGKSSQSKAYHLEEILGFYNEKYKQNPEHYEKRAWLYRFYKALEKEEVPEPIPDNFGLREHKEAQRELCGAHYYAEREDKTEWMNALSQYGAKYYRGDIRNWCADAVALVDEYEKAGMPRVDAIDKGMDDAARSLLLVF